MKFIAPLSLTIGVLLGSLLQPWFAYADAADVASLTKLLSPVQSMSGNFTQQITDAEGETIQSSEGTFELQKPGKLRWETSAPYSQLLVANGDKLWLYDPDLEQVTIKTVDQSLQQTPAAILSGNVDQLQERYEITLESRTASEEVYRFLPLQNQDEFESLVLRFSNATLSTLELHDSLGQTTAIAFKQVASNPVINSANFTFIPPPGTDVLIDD